MDDYLQILEDSLIKKKELLNVIIEKNRKQFECVDGKSFDDIDWGDFELLVAEKDIAIGQINKLDDGFQTLYDRVKEQLQKDKEKYRDRIIRMQELVTQVTDLGVEIRAEEERNRRKIESVIGSRKKVIKQTRNSLKVAQSYFKTMQSHAAMDMNILDKKK